MNKLERNIAAVAAIKDPGADVYLAAALPSADPLAQQNIVAHLIARKRNSGLRGLVTHYHHLEQDLQLQLQAQISLLAGVITMELADPHTPAAHNAMDLIRGSGRLEFAYLLPNGLRSQDSAVQELAATALLDLALHTHRRSTSAETPSAKDIQSLHEAISQALHSYQGHRQIMVLQALFLSGNSALEKFAPVLADSRHAATLNLCRLLENSREPWIRQNLLPMMLLSSLSESALAGFKRARLHGKHVDMFQHTHLLLLPRLRGVLRSLHDADQYIPVPADLPRMSAADQLGYVHWLERLPLDPLKRIEYLEQLAAASNPTARLMAVRALIELACGTLAEPAHQALSTYLADRQSAISQVALRQLLRVRWPGLLRLLPSLINSPHPAIRQLSTQFLAPLAFERLWSAWPKLTEKQKLSAGAAQLKFDPVFHRRLGERLCATHRQTRMRALAMISLLGQGSFFERPLLHLMMDHDAKVVASVVRCLGSTSLPPDPPLPTVQAALEKCLQHADARVRANAVEALDELGAKRHAAMLLKMAQSDASRPRANAIKALLRLHHPQALASISSMLADPHANQRTSALWVVQTLGLFEQAQRVAELSMEDPDPQVRQRADKVIHQLLGKLHDEPAPASSQPSALPRVALWLLIPALLWPRMVEAGLTLAQTTDKPTEWEPNQRWSVVGSELSKYLGENHISLPLGGLGILVGLMLIVLAGIRLFQYWKNPSRHPLSLFTYWKLAGSLGLSWRQRWLLYRIARQQNLPSPLTLVLSPTTLHHHAEDFLRNHPSIPLQKALPQLEQQLFGE